MKNLLGAPPTSVLFVYGPKSSGKSTLMMKIASMYPGEAIYYDFRARSPTELYNVLTVPRPGPATRLKEYLRRRFGRVNIREGIEVSPSKLKAMSLGKLDPFAPLIRALRGYKRPVLVLDEIQNLKHSGLDRNELSQLFNFLVTITKRLHIAHVIVVTSDCLFVDEIVKAAELEETAQYLFVGDLPKKSVLDWMAEEGMDPAKAKKVYDTLGGRPYDLWVVVQHFRAAGDIDILDSMIRRKASRVRFLLKSAGAAEARLVKKLARGSVSLADVNTRVLGWAVENEVAFFDPVNGEVYAISRAMQNALKKI